MSVGRLHGGGSGNGGENEGSDEDDQQKYYLQNGMMAEAFWLQSKS